MSGKYAVVGISAILMLPLAHALAGEPARIDVPSRLEGLATEWPGHLELIDRLRERKQHATEHFEHDHEAGEVPLDQEAVEHAAIQRAVIDAQRLAIIDLRDRGVIGDQARLRRKAIAPYLLSPGCMRRGRTG